VRLSLFKETWKKRGLESEERVLGMKRDCESEERNSHVVNRSHSCTLTLFTSQVMSAYMGCLLQCHLVNALPQSCMSLCHAPPHRQVFHLSSLPLFAVLTIGTVFPQPSLFSFSPCPQSRHCHEPRMVHVSHGANYISSRQFVGFQVRVLRHGESSMTS